MYKRQTVDGVRYDTRKAESLCSNKVVMFEDFYVELFEDAAGNYFTVLYQLCLLYTSRCV